MQQLPNKKQKTLLTGSTEYFNWELDELIRLLTCFCAHRKGTKRNRKQKNKAPFGREDITSTEVQAASTENPINHSTNPQEL